MSSPFARAWARHNAGQADLPHQDIPWATKRIIVDAIREAWRRVYAAMTSAGDAPLDCTEPELTTLLQVELNQIRAQGTNGFSGSLFAYVPRDASEVSFDGEHLEKKPDLAIRLIDRAPGRDGSGRALFVECKIVDRTHSVALYGCHGIRRFVDGEYAWQMPCALMVVYAGDGYSVLTKLEPHLKNCSARAVDCYQTQTLPGEDVSMFTGVEPRVYVSTHGRSWTYPGTTRSPGPIDLYHVWLPASP